MSFVFWTGYPNHHLSGWISELARICGTSVHVIAEKEMSEARKKLGWSMPDYSPATFELGITLESVARVIETAGPKAIHVFHGLNMTVYAGMHMAFLECLRRGGLRLGLMSEHPVLVTTSNRHFWKASRMLWGKLNHLRYGRHLDFVLSFGELAGIWFRRLGYKPEQLFPFGYCPPAPVPHEAPASALWPSGPVRLMHLGEIKYHKGIDRVVDALGALQSENWFYGLVGCGDLEKSLKSRAADLGIGNKIAFWGAMPGPKAMNVVCSADVLILASRMDGYGAVVNEALYRGVPVICSSGVGACQVIRPDPCLGSVFSSPESLREALKYWIDFGPRTEARSAKIRHYSKSILPSAGAAYFFDIMSHLYDGAPRPTPPWTEKKWLESPP
jgi:glycosyltransferase involved in cell wall biosynthesis